MTILILNGPNLNMLGTREPELYGRDTLADIEAYCTQESARLGVTIDFRQTNHEGVLIDWVHGAQDNADGIVLNAAALARTSLSLHDAVAAINVDVIEVHLTNIYKRDSTRPPSMLSRVCRGVICGFSKRVYGLALHEFARQPAINKD